MDSATISEPQRKRVVSYGEMRVAVLARNFTADRVYPYRPRVECVQPRRVERTAFGPVRRRDVRVGELLLGHWDAVGGPGG